MVIPTKPLPYPSMSRPRKVTTSVVAALMRKLPPTGMPAVPVSQEMVIALVMNTAPKLPNWPGSRQLISPPGLVFARAVAKVLHGADFRRRRHDENRRALRDCRGDPRQEIGMDHDRLGRAVAQHVARLVRREVPIHGYRISTDQAGAHRRLEEGEIVAQHKRDGVVLADSNGTEARGGARGPRGQVRLPDLALAADDQSIHNDDYDCFPRKLRMRQTRPPARRSRTAAAARQFLASAALGTVAPPLLPPVLLVPSLWICAPPPIKKPVVLLKKLLPEARMIEPLLAAKSPYALFAIVERSMLTVAFDAPT